MTFGKKPDRFDIITSGICCYISTNSGVNHAESMRDVDGACRG